MTQQSDNSSAGEPVSESNRVFLVLADESEEMHVALRFACLRAKNTGGRVALLHVLAPAEFVHWLGVEAIMKQEIRDQGEALLQKYAAEVNRVTGKPAIMIMREGDQANQVAQLLREDRTISILVLAASTSAEGPGPVVSQLTGRGLGELRTPITIVPGGLTEEEIDAIT